MVARVVKDTRVDRRVSDFLLVSERRGFRGIGARNVGGSRGTGDYTSSGVSAVSAVSELGVSESGVARVGGNDANAEDIEAGRDRRRGPGGRGVRGG